MKDDNGEEMGFYRSYGLDKGKIITCGADGKIVTKAAAETTLQKSNKHRGSNMKKAKRFISMLCVLAICAIPIAMASCSGGCSTKAGRTAFVASGVTHVGVAAGLTAWDNYLGKEYTNITTQASTEPDKAAKRKAELLAKEAQLKAATEKYQAAQLTVLTAAQAFSQIPSNDPNSPGAQDRLNAAVAASTATLAQVLSLLETFGVTKR